MTGLDLRAIARATGGEVSGAQVLAPGPGHAPRDRSLSITLSATSPDGFIVHSHAGDDWRTCLDHVRDRIGLPRDSGKRETSTALGPIKAVYDYTDEAGKLLFQALRFDPKQFRQRTGPDQKKWSIDGVRIVPFRLPELIEDIALEHVVFVVEGERDVLTLRGLGVPASTNPMGAGKWREQFNEHFSDADVVVCGDNDKAGRAHVDLVASNLYGVAKRVRVLDLKEFWPDIPDGGDISDWFDRGAGTAERLYEIVERLPDWQRSTGADQDGKAAPTLAYSLTWDGEAGVETKVPELIEDMLPQIGVALLSGQWGLFKTFTALDLALSVMTMTPFAGHNTLRQGGVLFIAAEGAKYIPGRLLGVKQTKAPDKAPEGAALMSKERMPFARTKSCPKLTDDEALPTLIATAKAAAAELERRFNLPLALIVIDAMTSAAGFKDANDTAESGRVMAMLNKLVETTEALVLVVDHFGKDPTTGTRNSSAKEDGVDVVLALIGDRTMAGLVSNTRLAIRKNRDGETGIEIPFRQRLIELQDGGATLVIDWSESETARQDQKRNSVPKSLAIFMKAMDFALCNTGEEICPFNDRRQVRAVKRDLVRHEFIKTYPAENQRAKDKAFERCEKNAIASEIITAREVGPAEGVATFYWRQNVK